jgi:hypothetical protein
MDDGFEISGISTSTTGADHRVGYVVQVVHSNRWDTTIMLAYEICDGDLWRIAVQE